MTWTNITIPDRFSTTSQQSDIIQRQEHTIAMLNSKLDIYEKELQNIFDAAVKFGYVDITYGKEKIKLVLKKD